MVDRVPQEQRAPCISPGNLPDEEISYPESWRTTIPEHCRSILWRLVDRREPIHDADSTMDSALRWLREIEERRAGSG